MSDKNFVCVFGRLTRDAELRYFQSGAAISTFSIACGRSVKKNEEWEDITSFFDCKAFGKAAEKISPSLQKGREVCVVGRLEQERWEKDGKSFSRVVVAADTVRLVGKVSIDGGDRPYEERRQMPVDDGARDSFDDDIPF